MKRLLPFLALLLLSACGGSTDADLSGTSDQPDSAVDSQTTDSGTPAQDSGTGGSSSQDSGSVSQDSGTGGSSVQDSGTADSSIHDSGAVDSGAHADASPDTGTGPVDAAADTNHSDATPDPLDGTPERIACTDNFGSAMSTKFGRLDGYLISIVPPGGHACNGDSDHVHLQVRVNNGVYDIAVNVSDSSSQSSPVLYKAMAFKAKVGAWAEGWHESSESFDYVNTLQLHSSDFAGVAKADLVQNIQTELEVANHISVFATGYGPTGGHLIHRNHSNADGAIIVDPVGKNPRVLVFHFADQSF